MLHIEIAAEKIFNLSVMPVTNTLLMSWLTLVFLSSAAIFLFKKISIIPAGLQNIFEFLTENLLDLMQGIFGSRDKAEKYLPIVATIFIFILVSNWFGIFPGIGSIGFFEERGTEKIFVPLLRSSASDLNFTLAIAVSAVVLVNFFGIAAVGAAKHFSKFFNFKGPIDFFVGILEFISEIAKMISFSFRLFGNVFAGEVLLVITVFLVPFFVPVPFLVLEIFVGFIQALVFSMLTMVFLALAVVEHGNEH